MLRRVTRGASRLALAFAAVAALFVASALIGYANLFTERTAWPVLARASGDIRTVGSTLSDRLGDGEVSDVT
ncbi:MAG: hypothetical protein LH650_01320 [Chloroflexi bacterium]|nr:hypothetical protein [Chloroflexota bacterium]